MCLIDSVEFVARFRLLLKLIACHETGAQRGSSETVSRVVKEGERETVREMLGERRRMRRRGPAH